MDAAPLWRAVGRVVPPVVAAGLVLAVPTAAGAVPDAGGAAPGTAPAVWCRSKAHPELADRLERELAGALEGRAGVVSFRLRDAGRRPGLSCGRAGARRYDAASVAKLMIMEATAHRAQAERRGLSAWEKKRLRPMITRSDNDAASELWQHVGRQQLRAFLRRAGTRDTEPGWGPYWGLTQTSARDQLRLLALLTEDGSFLPFREYQLHLLAQVRAGQRWGVPAGAPAGVRVHVKNGWLPRSHGGWRVHSVGAFTGGAGAGRRDYRLAVLTRGNASMAYGVRSIERLAHAVHGGLHPGSAAARGLTPGHLIDEVPDHPLPDEAALEGRGLPEAFRR